MKNFLFAFLTAATALSIITIPVVVYGETYDSATYVESNNNMTEYLAVVENDDWDYDVLWEITCDGTLTCSSSDGKIDYTMKKQDSVLYVDGTNFEFTTSVIPNFLEEENAPLNEWLFNNSIYEVIFSDSITSVDTRGMSTFFINTNNVKFGNNIQYIGEMSFGVNSIKELILPESLVEIDDAAFIRSKELQSLVIPSGVKRIGSNAFKGSENLKDITILSKDAELVESGFGFTSREEHIDGIIIHGYAGSTAEQYANENSFTFITLEEASEATTTTATITTITTTAASTETMTTLNSTDLDNNSDENDSPKTGDNGVVTFTVIGMVFAILTVIFRKKNA